MADRRQHQKGGDGSTNIQAGGPVTINQGPTLAEVREIALDVFRSNFLELSGQAAETAKMRAEEITNDFIAKLEKANPSGIARASDPDFQYSLYTVQREYARTGDKELGGLLVDLLTDRSKYESRTIIQIVLGESLAVAPKLTSAQVDSLSVIFLLRYTVNNGLGKMGAFYEYLDRFVKPFADNVAMNIAAYQHLEYAGCGAISIGSVDLGQAIREKYGGLFSKGITQEDIDGSALSPLPNQLLIPCLNDSNLFQVAALNKNVLDERCTEMGVSEENAKKLHQLHTQGLMQPQEIKDRVVEERPYMQRVFDAWEKNMCQFTLTSVGIAIGHANIKRIAGAFTDLESWIN